MSHNKTCNKHQQLTYKAICYSAHEHFVNIERSFHPSLSPDVGRLAQLGLSHEQSGDDYSQNDDDEAKFCL